MLNTELIRQTMADMQMSQAELGRRVGVSQHTISVMLSTGKASDKTITGVMKALEITEEELNREEETRTQAELDLIERVERLERIVGDLLGMRRIYRKR